MPEPAYLVLPDLEFHCTFPVRISRHHKSLPAKTKAWFFRGRDNGHKMQCAIFNGLKPTLLAAVGYPEAGYQQLRLCSDFITYLFLLDDASDELGKRDITSVADVVLNSLYHPHTYCSSTRISEMAKDLAKRMSQTATIRVQHRFMEALNLFFQSVNDQAQDRLSGAIPTLEQYILLRRDTSGCRPCWALIEYANNLDIPDEVHEHPVIRGLSDAAADLAGWSNDLFSYNVERSRGDTHNMIVVAMHHHNLDLFSAAEFVGDMCRQAIEKFNVLRKEVPSWGGKVDQDVAQYVQGLADWIVGCVHWSFETERYFGKANKSVKATRHVQLLPLGY
ncbi:isoprenoid synthase domain-containing protein [Mycena vulgaris]|nr:isoprenoid synthase domain-containing protein [Mycena vulgaris]